MAILENSRLDYEARMNRVTDYIFDHLGEDIDFAGLAEIACLSPYHWHRVYHAMRGETITATIKRLRLHRAAGDLARGQDAVETVAQRWGYRNIQSFTRIFAASYGMPPAQYRKKGSHATFKTLISEGNAAMYDVSIEEIPAMPLVGVPHRGSYMMIGKAYGTLFTSLEQRRLLNGPPILVGIYYDDPMSVPEGKLRSFAAVRMDAPASLEPPLEAVTIAAGPCAKLLYRGPYADMHAAYRWLYGTWLPQSGREASDLAAFEIYLNSPTDTAPADLITEIYLPLNQARG